MFFQYCNTIPIFRTRKERETECQRCRRYFVTVPTTKYVRQCNPIFDERCHTEYIKHCKTDQRCTMLYQTVCQNQGYEQLCTNEVGRLCRIVKERIYCLSGVCVSVQLSLCHHRIPYSLRPPVVAQRTRRS